MTDARPVLAEVAKTPLYDLADLLGRPELLRVPPVIMPHFAFEGRLTLLAAGEKVGKSTLLGQAVAANVEGVEFLGEAAANRTVLWLALDEPLGDAVRRFARHGVKGGVHLYNELPSFVELEAAIDAAGTGAVVIDTLTEFVAGFIDDPNSPMQWQPILKKLRGIAQRTGAAIVLLHHVSKTTGRYRDSSQIGAGVDQIVEMSEVENDPALRKCRVRGRIHSETFTIRYIDGRYELEGAGLPLEVKVLRAIESNPGIGLNKLRKAIGVKTQALSDELRRLRDRGVIENRGLDDAHAWYAKPTSSATGPGMLVSHERNSGSHSGNGAGNGCFPELFPEEGRETSWETVGREPVSHERNSGKQAGNALGNATVSHTPIKGGMGNTSMAGSADTLINPDEVLGSGAHVRVRQGGGKVRVETVNGELLGSAEGSPQDPNVRAKLTAKVAADRYAGPTRREDLGRIFARLDAGSGSR